MVFENDKFILFKSDMFIEKGYHCDSLFKMNVMTIVITDEKIRFFFHAILKLIVHLNC